MRVLVVGSGGREHALAWRLGVEGIDVLVAPGNAGTLASVAVQAADIPALADLAERERIDLTIVGPETPLALGLVDHFAQRGIAAFGPTRAAARLEWSKAWAKDFMHRYAIPTARAEVVDSEAAARQVLARFGLPTVLKADGLAAGKGVFVAITLADVEEALDLLFHRRTLGSAADRVLIEELLEGPELSVLAFTDGERLSVMPPARDYKRLLDGDRGPNTGGMGGFTWPSYATSVLMDEVRARVLEPTLAGMQPERHPYRGILYVGLMMTADGPKVLEFNCRFGDPECQLILPLLESGLADACAAIVADRFRPEDVRWAERRTYGVVLAADGYPEAPRVGDRIDGLGDEPEGVRVFHAGTRLQDGHVVTAGGRVLTLVGADREAVYRTAEVIRFEGKQFRGDIGIEVPSTVAATR